MTHMQTINVPHRSRMGTDAAVIHVHYAKRSFDISMIGLGLTPTSHDDHVKYEIARFLDVADNYLDDYVIDRHVSGNLTICPRSIGG